MAATASGMLPCAVTITTVVSWPASLSCRRISIPSIPGIFRSSSTTSGARLIKTPEGRRAVPGLQGFVTRRLQGGSEHQPDARLVVNDQDRRGLLHGVPLSRAAGSPLLDGRPCFSHRGKSKGRAASGITTQATYKKGLTSIEPGQSLASSSGYAVRNAGGGRQLARRGGRDHDRSEHRVAREFTDAMTQHSRAFPLEIRHRMY